MSAKVHFNSNTKKYNDLGNKTFSQMQDKQMQLSAEIK